MASLHKFTTKEVLNKVLLDSSGNSVAMFSHTTQEALNAVLDSTNSRLNVSLVGGTISGDVTISGDLTVEGDSYANVSETVQGDMIITSSSSSDSKPLFQFINTDTSNNYGGELQFYKNASAGSDNDQLGKILFYGNNDAGTPEKTAFASIFAYSADVSDSTEDGYLRIRTLKAGTNTDTIAFKSGRVAIGHTSPSYNLDVQNAEGTYVAKFTAGWSSGYGIWIKAGNQGHGYGESTQVLRMDNGFGTTVFNVKSDGRVSLNTSNYNSYDMPTLEVRGQTFTATQYITASGDATVNLGGSRDDQKIVKVGYQVRGTGIPDSSEVASVTSNTQFELTQNASSTQSDTDLTFAEPGTIKLSHPSAFIHNSNTIGKIDFQAPLEGSGGDAILTGASIKAVAESNFSSTDNSTALVFSTNTSAEATERMRITSAGLVGIGTSSPSDKLEVYGNGADTAIRIHEDAGTHTAQLHLRSGGNDVKLYADNSKFYITKEDVSLFRLDNNSRISVGNNDGNTSNTVFGKTAFTDSSGATLGNVGADYNVVIGELAMGSADTTTATDNVAIGYYSLNVATSASSNVSIGSTAMRVMATGASNVGIGHDAIKVSTAGKYMTIVGAEALAHATDWANDGTVAIGYKAAYEKVASGGQYTGASVHIGYASGAAQTTGTGNTSVGHATMGGNPTGTALTGADNTVMGYSAGYAMEGDANRNTIMGSNAGVALTDGSEHVIIGANSGKGITDAGNNTYIGFAVATNTSSNGHSNTLVGSAVASGGALTGNYNTSVGRNSLLMATSASNNVVMGYYAGGHIGSGASNTFIGYAAGANGESDDIASNTATDNIAIGYQAMGAAYGTVSNHFTATNNVAIGRNSMKNNKDSSENVVIGYLAGELLGENGELRNVIIGSRAGGTTNSATADDNVVIGYAALGNSTTRTVSESVFIGKGSGGGTLAGTARYNVAVGMNTMAGAMDGAEYNTGLGHQALNGLTEGDNNVAVGASALEGNTTGRNNTAVGKGALSTRTTGMRNTALGAVTLANNGGDDNTALGYAALNIATGSNNVCVGSFAGDVIQSGLNNTIIGKGSDPSANNATNQTVIGFAVTGITDNSVVLGNAAVTKVYMSSDGDAEIYANGTINTSDKRLKENIEDSDLGLEFVNKLRPVKYNYIKDKHDGKTKYGIIAQEVQEVLKESNNEDFAGIKDSDEYLGADYIQFVAPLIKSVQELSAKVKELEAKLSK